MVRKPQQGEMAMSAIQAPENSFHAEDRKHWRNWLQKNHARPDGVWLVLWNKASGRAHFSMTMWLKRRCVFAGLIASPTSWMRIGPFCGSRQESPGPGSRVPIRTESKN